MEDLLEWVMLNTNGYMSISNYKWGGNYTAYSISFHAVTYSRGMQRIKCEKYCTIGNDMDLKTACKFALDRLKSGYLSTMGGDVINDKIGGRFIDGLEFTETSFGDIIND